MAVQTLSEARALAREVAQILERVAHVLRRGADVGETLCPDPDLLAQADELVRQAQRLRAT